MVLVDGRTRTPLFWYADATPDELCVSGLAKRTLVEGRYNHGIIATRNIIDHNRPVWAKPAPLLALLLVR
jgi:type IV secretory pathway protease TraF